MMRVGCPGRARRRERNFRLLSNAKIRVGDLQLANQKRRAQLFDGYAGADRHVFAIESAFVRSSFQLDLQASVGGQRGASERSGQVNGVVAEVPKYKPRCISRKSSFPIGRLIHVHIDRAVGRIKVNDRLRSNAERIEQIRASR